LGGAVGDALGAPVEFHSIHMIHNKYGPEGIKDYDVAYGRRGAITDDTQMTLFTAEGLLRANTRQLDKGICHPATVIYHAYIRWLRTQGERSRSSLSQDKPEGMPREGGWLIGVKALHSRRAPGNTCLSALRGEEMGEMQRPLNNSKGCGGVMRVAPIGLVAGDEEHAFSLGCEAAAITHGHPSGYYSAGCFAAIIWRLAEGRSLPEAIELTLRQLEEPENEDHEECAAAIRQAVTLWRDRELTPSPEVIERMGGGWVGEEALAISLYCALVAGEDFAHGVLLAVNHSGDSDSTGAITGNLLGLMLGVEAIPEKWLAELELRAEIAAIADDLFKRFEDTDVWRERYPGW
jgi:ADP-ribosylglycohydrolase